MKTLTFNMNTTDGKWLEYGWQRVRPLIPSSGGPLPITDVEPSGSRLNREMLIKLLERRGAKAYRRSSIPLAAFEGVIDTLRSQLRQFDWLGARIFAHDIQGLENGIYVLNDNNTIQLIRTTDSHEHIAPLVQNQWWVKGAGLSVFYTMKMVPASRAFPFDSGYHYAWLKLGQLGQQLLESATFSDLKVRMTPAISESLAQTALHIDHAAEEVVYYFRFGLEK